MLSPVEPKKVIPKITSLATGTIHVDKMCAKPYRVDVLSEISIYFFQI